MIKMKMSITTLLKEYAKLSSAHFALLSAMIPLMGAIAMGEIKFLRLPEVSAVSPLGVLS
jgi:hypothetical protein